MTLKIAVTGGIGSGKSMVCKVFAALGVPVYSADQQARELMNSDPALVRELKHLLGEEAYDQQGLRRKWVADRIFSNDELLAAVNSLVHPAVHRDFLRWASGLGGHSYVIGEAALTFESGGDRYYDRVVVVSAPVELRIRRVMQRDAVTEEEVRARMDKQWPAEEKELRAHHVIYNDNHTMILPQILALHAEFSKTEKQHV
ncbi:MAG: dephospho-CoA kinase [Bacteroidota bacterium]